MTDIKASADVTGLVQQWARDSMHFQQAQNILRGLLSEYGIDMVAGVDGKYWVRDKQFPTYPQAFDHAMRLYRLKLQLDDTTVKPVGEGEESPHPQPLPDSQGGESPDAPEITVLPDDAGAVSLKVKHTFGNSRHSNPKKPYFYFMAHSDAPKSYTDRRDVNAESIQLLRRLGFDTAILYLREGDKETLDLAQQNGLGVIGQGRARNHDDKDVESKRYSNMDMLKEFQAHPALDGFNFGDDFTDARKQHTAEWMAPFKQAMPNHVMHCISGGTMNIEKKGEITRPFDFAPYHEVADCSMPQIYLLENDDLGWIQRHIKQSAQDWHKVLMPTLPLYDEKGYITPAKRLLAEMVMCFMGDREDEGIAGIAYYTKHHAESGDWNDPQFAEHMKAMESNIALGRVLAEYYLFGDLAFAYGSTPTDWSINNHYVRVWELNGKRLMVAVNGSVKRAWKISRTMKVPVGANVTVLANGDDFKPVGAYLDATLEPASALVMLMDAPAQAEMPSGVDTPNKEAA